ncbi:MAG: DNA/RNA non-specific endonuclease [Clostridia bacterium]|nr:DNA/RNA non-specific endonuclease [Clostridia bacterium]
MKHLSIWLAAILLLSCVAGCTVSPDEWPSVDSDVVTSTTTTAETPSGDSESGADENSTADSSTTTSQKPTPTLKTTTTKKPTTTTVTSKIPAYSGKAYVALDGNRPSFSKAELTVHSYESYESLDAYGRCGVAIASIGRDLMPTEDRGSIGQIKPSGWHTVKYDNVDGKYLYNRCHLIGFQLTGENANEQNLLTGTRYLNIEGMLPFENMVADYIKETGNHVAYRVTPIFRGNNLVASGVQMEAYSIEDAGEGICFNVYCYNVQPGIVINYADGDSRAEGVVTGSTTKKTSRSTAKPTADGDPDGDDTDGSTVYRTPSGKRYHLDPDCGGKNSYEVTYQQAINAGLTPCQKCA